MNHAVASATHRCAHRCAGRAAHQPLRLRPLALALLLAGCSAPLSGLAQAQNRNTLPSGMTVVQGQASATSNGSQLTVTNSANALLNWQSFSIGAGASVRFEQPGADSRVLNRVVGNDPSQIFGQLSSNGQVWLLNANGVLFGRDARVDVAGLVASTLNLLPADWQAGRLLLREAGASATGASVVNQGELRSTLGGHVLLVGGAGGVRNEGRIEAPGGTVGLAAGRSVELADSRTPNIAVRIDAGQGGSGSGSTVSNVGTLLAAGGQVDLAGAIVNQSGIVRADSLPTPQGGQAGRVTLRGSESVTLATGSVTSADGQGEGPAGQVRIDSGATGLTQVAGRLDARSDAGPGGRIEILGERVALLDGASADVSGRRGGGGLYVGGGALGRDPTIRNARASYIARGARLTADATGAGDGGRIVVWGNTSTRAYGHFSARGGAEGGNGGLVETSGGWLDARPASMRSDAPRGRAGQWLLDPYDLTITDAANVPRTGADQNVDNVLDSPTRYFEPNNSPSYLSAETIATALNGGSNVAVTTSRTAGNATGRITIDNAHINVTPSQAVTLTVAADGDLVMSNSRIASTGQPLDVYFSAGTPPVAGTANYRTIRFSNASIDSAGAAFAGGTRGVIDLSAAYVQFDGGTTLTSQAGGNAITLHQGTGDNLFSFTNDAGATALNTPRGRWRLYISEPYESYAGGGLAHDATIYGTTYPGSGTPDLPTSNLLLFSYQPVLFRTEGGRPISRSYDGSTRVFVSDSGQIDGMVNGDRIIGFFSNANAGNGKTIELFPGGALAQGIDSTGKPVYGYDGETIGLTAATGTFTLTGSITPQALTLSGATVASKVYDGSNAASLSGGSLSGLIGSETLQLGGSFAFANANAGTAKAVTGTATLADGGNGGLAANYTLTNPTVSTTGTITPRPVTLSGVTAANRTYDGSTVASVSGGTLSGLVEGEQLTLQSSGQFDNRNAGTGKTVTVSTTLANGPNFETAAFPRGLASNYQLTNPTTTTTATISPRSLSVAGATAADKLYDGRSTATITSWQLRNLVEGDQVSVTTGQASFADPAVGNAKPVSATALSLGGTDSGNYRLNAEGSTATTQASILPARFEDRSLPKPPPMPPMERPATSTDGRTLDATSAMRFDASGRSTFTALDLANLPTDRIAAILETRQRYKESAFAGALQQLEVNPNLADAPACLTIEQSHSGACLVTSELKAAVGPREQTTVAAAAASTAATAVGTGPAAPSGASSAATPAATPTTPAAAPPAAAAAAAPGAPAPALRPPVTGRPTPRLAAVPQIQRKIALVIGIDHYADARIPSLDGALKDANAVADVFARKLGYETVVIQDASREAIFRALNRLALQARPEDSVLIYYAGHGDLIEKTRIGYWIPSNASVDRPQTWISNNDIGRLLSLISASQVALVSDSCFSGSLIAGDALRSTGGEADPSTLLRHRSAVVMSSGGNEPVADMGKNGHSPFAWNLMRNLEKVASWRPGSNVFEQVRQAVIREVPQHPRYGPAVAGRHEAGGDYLFETRQYE